MAGLGALFGRNVEWSATDTETGQTKTWTAVTDMGGLAPRWPSGDYRGAMGLPGAWRAAVLLSDLLAGLPWHALRTGADGQTEPVPSLLLDQPNPPETRATSFSSLALDYLMHGNAIGVYGARDAYGYPTALVPVSAETVGVKRVTGHDDRDPFGAVVYDINGERFQAEDVLHIRGPAAPGALRGMGVLETHMSTLELAEDLHTEARTVGRHGVPTGKLKVTNPDATEADLKAAKAGWLKAQRERTVAVLNATTDFEALSWNPSETQLIEARKFSLNEIALMFGLDPSWLGAAQTTRTYANVQDEAINLVKFSLSGHLARFEQALALAFPPGTWVTANLDALLKADTRARYGAHAQGITAGFLSPNEARALEDLPEIEGLDEAWQAGLFRSPPAPAAPPQDDETDQDPAVEDEEDVNDGAV